MAVPDLPTFVVIGGMKAGTTSLHLYLDQHPDIFMTKKKELDYFVAEREWSRGQDWYESHFQRGAAHLARGETSPNYSKAHKWRGVPERMASVVPDCRIVYLVREPLARMRSHYTHLLASRGTDVSFREEVFDRIHLRACSDYAGQLERFADHFPASQLLVLDADQLRTDRRAAVAEVVRFVGADPAKLPSVERLTETHTSQGKRSSRHAAVDRLLAGAPSWARHHRLDGARRLAKRVITKPVADHEPLHLSEPDLDRLADELVPQLERLRPCLPPAWSGWGWLDERRPAAAAGVATGR